MGGEGGGGGGGGVREGIVLSHTNSILFPLHHNVSVADDAKTMTFPPSQKLPVTTCNYNACALHYTFLDQGPQLKIPPYFETLKIYCSMTKVEKVHYPPSLSLSLPCSPDIEGSQVQDL